MRVSLLLPLIQVVLAQSDGPEYSNPLEGILEAALYGISSWGNSEGSSSPWSWGSSGWGTSNEEDETEEDIEVAEPYNGAFPYPQITPDPTDYSEEDDDGYSIPAPKGFPPKGPFPKGIPRPPQFPQGIPRPPFQQGPPPPPLDAPLSPPPPGPKVPRPYLGPKGYGAGPGGPADFSEGPYPPKGKYPFFGKGPKGLLPFGLRGSKGKGADYSGAPWLAKGPSSDNIGLGNFGLADQAIPSPSSATYSVASPTATPQLVPTLSPAISPAPTPQGTEAASLPLPPVGLSFSAGNDASSIPPPPPEAPLPPGPNANTPPAAALPPAVAAGQGTFKLIPGRPGPLTVSIAVPVESASNDFIASLNGKGIGWGAMSIGAGMLNNLLVGVYTNGPTPQGGLLYASQYGMPQPFRQENITVSPIPSETWIKGDEWKYTFLCSGCFGLNPGLKAATPAPFGWAYAARDKTPTHKHERNGRDQFDLRAAKTDGFAAFAKQAVMA